MKIVVAAALLGSLIAGVGAAQAMPLAPAGDAAPAVIKVAGGCGPGWYRTGWGACRPMRGPVVVPGPVVVAPRVCPPGFVLGRYGHCRPI